MSIIDLGPEGGRFVSRLRAAPDREALRDLILERAKLVPNLRHVAHRFWGEGDPAGRMDWGVSTFPKDTPEIYKQAIHGLVWKRIVPLNWSDALSDASAARGETTPIGFSIPVRGLRGTHGMTCAQFDLSPEEWEAERETRMGRWTFIALEIHNRLEELFWQKRSDMALTVREIECVSLAARGKRSKEIAWELSLGEKTVNFHLSRARLKLRASNTTEAVMRAAELGLLQAKYTPQPVHA